MSLRSNNSSLAFGVVALASVCLAAVHAQAPIHLEAEVSRMNEIARQRAQASAPQPGVYTLRALHSQWCLAPTAAFGRVDYLRSVSCDDPASEVMLLPHPSGGMTVRPDLTNSRVASRRTRCATVARGVVLGPPAIDVLPCDFEALGSGRNWCAVGRLDQVFHFRRVGRRTFAIHESQTESPNADAVGDQCWDVRGASQDIGAETIRFECNGEAQQTFEVEFVRPIDATDEAACATAQGWRDTPDRLRRAVPVVGVDLPGGDYASEPTASDEGRACAARCAEDVRCRAFTWVAAGVQGTDAMCWLKDSIPPAQPAATVISSGIVRSPATR